MLILNLPAAEEAGWVTVEVHGSDETGKSSYLGQTTFFYFDEHEKVLELIIHNKEQYCSFFETWNAACKGHLTDSREKETKSSSSGKRERPLDIFYRSQVNVEFVVKRTEKTYVEDYWNSYSVCLCLWRYACDCK